MDLLDPRDIDVQVRDLSEPVATISIDVETDYGTDRTEALSQIDRFLDLVDELDVPLTAFVEGQFFENRQELCRLLLDRGVDVQLHCYDHTRPGDTPDELRRGAAAYADFCGWAPRGYRAHTYRLTNPLYETLLDVGFLWDSSLMTAIAQSRNTAPQFAEGDYFVLDGSLTAFPMGKWRGVPLAFNHAYRLLMKSPGEAVFRAAFGPTRLAPYNVHMTDLVRNDSLASAVRSPLSRLLHKYMWITHGADTFGSFRSVVKYLRRQGYRLESTDDLHRRVTRAATT